MERGDTDDGLAVYPYKVDPGSNSLQVFMNQLNGDSSLPHGRSHASYRTMPYIASSKDAGHVGFEDKGIS